MNNRVYKELSDFVLSGTELVCVEKALYALLDKFKTDRITNYASNFNINYHEVIERCFEKVRLHENYLKNRNFFVVTIPKHDPDPILEMLGDDLEKVEESTMRKAKKEKEKEMNRKKARSKVAV